MRAYYINAIDQTDDETGQPLFWSGDSGWATFASAQSYPAMSGALPVGGRWVMLPRRFRNAYMIQQGACNPAGIARSLVEACDECLAEGVSQRADPAVRLITHQLAYLMDTRALDTETSTYTELYDLCRDRNDDTFGIMFIPTR